MIGKKVANPDHSASKAVRIGRLAAYIRDPGRESSTEKCVYSGARGFLTGTEAGQAAEMLALAEDAVRTSDPINHYVLSWREGEHPTPEQVEEAVDIVLDEMELADYQAIYGLHADTDNLHLHVMVNRAYQDEETDRVKVRKINRGYDIDCVHRVGARIEWAQGWVVEANKRYRVLGDGTLERTSRKEAESAPGGPGQQQLDRERRTGEQSAVRSASELAAPIIAKAESWEALHAGLAERGLRYERSDRARTGAVVIVGDVVVKASRVSRAATLRKLESRLDPYRPSDRSRERPVEPRDAVALIAGAKSWGELHTRLAESGLRYEKVGSGARVVAGALEVKASVVSREASLGRLEKRLGPYEPAGAPPSVEDPSPRKAPAKVELKAIARLVADAKSWSELHATLAEHEVRYERFGSGGRIIAGATIVKASTVGRLASLGALQKRLGAFEPATTDASVSREPQALDPEMARVDEYRAARAAYRKERDAEWLGFASKHEDERNALREKQAREREKLHGHDWQGLGAALNAMRSVLAHQHAMERAELRDKRRQRREAHRRRYRPWPSYEEWLRAEGLSDWAERWRYQRPPAFEGRGESPAVPRDIRGYEAKVDGARVVYRRRGAPPGAPDAFRDSGRRIDVLDWRSDESTLATLELPAAKWGAFEVTGNEEFKARCARLAAEHGFQITNPELQQSIARERERLRVDVEPPPGQAQPPQEPPLEREIEPWTPPAPVPSTSSVAEESRNICVAGEEQDHEQASHRAAVDEIALHALADGMDRPDVIAKPGSIMSPTAAIGVELERDARPVRLPPVPAPAVAAAPRSVVVEPDARPRHMPPIAAPTMTSAPRRVERKPEADARPVRMPPPPVPAVAAVHRVVELERDARPVRLPPVPAPVVAAAPRAVVVEPDARPRSIPSALNADRSIAELRARRVARARVDGQTGTGPSRNRATPTPPRSLPRATP